jgi:hypothetical protein
MKKNTISVSVNYVNGNYQDVLNCASPKEALDEYLFPDPGMPISYSLSATDKAGKFVTIFVNKDEVSFQTD